MLLNISIFFNLSSRLKPENIFLDSNRVIIGDFGLACCMKTKICENQGGSVHYTAPEVFLGGSYDGRSADVWSAGVILFALLSGRLPFDDESQARLVEKIRRGIFRMGDFPPEVCNLISRMLATEGKNRITIEQIKMHPAFRTGLCDGYVMPKPVPPANSVDPIKCCEAGSCDGELALRGNSLAKALCFRLVREAPYGSLVQKIGEVPRKTDVAMKAVQAFATNQGLTWVHPNDYLVVCDQKATDLRIEIRLEECRKGVLISGDAKLFAMTESLTDAIRGLPTNVIR
jgi:hypothetical protein